MDLIYENQTNQALFPKLTQEELKSLESYGQRMHLAPGTWLYREGTPDHYIYVVLSGELQVFKKIGNEEELLATHLPGDFAGDIMMQIGAPTTASIKPVKASEVIRIDTANLNRIVVDHSEIGNKILRAFHQRSLEVESQGRQGEKLAALGRLAAGLSHEINNPASAVLSAERHMKTVIAELEKLGPRLLYSRAPADDWRVLNDFIDRYRYRRNRQAPIVIVDQETEFEDWLARRGLGELVPLVPTIVGHEISPGDLEPLEKRFPGSKLRDALRWIHGRLELTENLEQIESAASRITRLVSAVKDYTYLDRNPREVVDIHHGLEMTLTMLQNRLKKGVQVVREFAPDLPKVYAHGGELNEVWTNLIINALDALNDKGTLTLRTCRNGSSILVEIEDSGPGIPAALQPRVWEPFFTTKPVGTGTGLGLDISRRIIEKRHQGSIRFESQPGRTVFTVKLPRVA